MAGIIDAILTLQQDICQVLQLLGPCVCGVSSAAWSRGVSTRILHDSADDRSEQSLLALLVV